MSARQAIEKARNAVNATARSFQEQDEQARAIEAGEDPAEVRVHSQRGIATYEGHRHGCATCGQLFASAEEARAHIKQEHRGLGEFTTRELLEEMRLRGDLAMVAMPTSERGADGSVLSALAGVLLKSSCKETLESRREE